MEKIEIAKLRLAFLKENRDYQKAYQDLKKREIENPYKDWPGNKSNDSEYKTFHIACELWKKFIDPTCEIPFNFLFQNTFFAEKDLLTLIDSSLDVNNLSQSVIKRLPSFFHTNAIKTGFTDGDISGRKLKSSERVVIIDLQKKKTDIMAELSYYIDYMQKKAPKTRNRIKEAWVQLEIWRLWKKGQGFKQIAPQVNMTYDAVKMAFHRAYEQIYHKPYDVIDVWEKESRNVPKPDIKQFCKDCPHQPSCKNPCAEFLEFIEMFIGEDDVPQRELPLSQMNLPQDCEDPLSYLKEKNRNLY